LIKGFLKKTSPVLLLVFAFLFLSLFFSQWRISAAASVAFQGTVTDADSNAVENAVIKAFPADPNSTVPPVEVLTDANGDYAISASAVTSGTAYSLEVFPPQSGTGGSLISPKAQSATYTGTTITRDFTFTKATNTIKGKVTLSSNGSAVSGARVNAFKREGSAFVQTTTDASGDYTLTVSGGDWEVMPEATSSDNWAYGQPPETARFAADAENKSTTINFSVDPATATISGRVVDPDGNPVANVGVGVFNQEGKGGGGPVKNDGTFAIKVPAGTFMVSVWTPPDSQYGSPSIPSVTVKDNETYSFPNDIKLVTRNATISGSVKDASDNGVKNIYVEAFVRDGGGFSEGQTDASGNFSMKVTAGRWMVMPRLDANASYALNDPPTEVTVAANQTKTVDFVLQSATATIQGVLQDENGSTVAAYGYAFADKAGGGMFGPGGLGGPVERGSFSFKVPAGSYSVNVGLAPGSSYTPGAAKAVTVKDGETKNVVIKLKTNNATISGSVVNASGGAVTGLNGQLFVFAISSNHTFQEGTVTEVKGATTYSIKVAAGDWSLGFFIDPASGYMSAPPDPTDRLTAPATKNIVLQQADATISGTVTQPDGKTAAAGVFVSVDNRETQGKEFFNGTSTDSNGSYQLKITSGSYKVRVNVDPSSGYLSPPEKTVTVASGGTETANFSLRSSDATITGKATLGGSGVAAFVYAWADDGGFAQTIAAAGGNYTLAVSKGTVWHVGARYETGTKPYQAAETSVDLTSSSSGSADLSLSQLSYSLPPALTMTFDATKPKLITLTDGTAINIPAAALATSGNVTLTITPKTSLPSKKGDKPVWYGYDFSATDSTGQKITSFNSNVTITFPYTDAQLAAQGITAGDLIPSYWDSTSGTWKKVSNVSVDTTAKTVTITINHFTDFALTANITGGTSSSSTTASTTTSAAPGPVAPGCRDPGPGSKAPRLYAAVAEGRDAIRLYFTEADGPLDRYVLEYGLSSGNYQYGADPIGGPKTRTYVVRSLVPKTTYYFRVRAGNGCGVGPWSNELSAATSRSTAASGGTVKLATSGGKGEASPAAKTRVKRERRASEQKGSRKTGGSLSGYRVRVRVVDQNQRAVAGAKVLLYSKPREAITDARGMAEFTGVEAGEHRVVVVYQNYRSEQKVHLSGKTPEVNVNVTLQPTTTSRKRMIAILAAGLMGLFLAGLFVWREKIFSVG
jgi:hypothetical protein